MPFVPGQLVKCVDAVFKNHSHRDGLSKGQIYTVREWVGEEYCIVAGSVDGVRIQEILRPGDATFRASRFVPIDDKALDIFRQVLTDAPKDMETV